MGSSDVLLLLVDHKFKAIGGRVSVDTTDDTLVVDLKHKIMALKPGFFSQFPYLDAFSLTVWRTKHELVINYTTAECDDQLELILEKIDLYDEDTIEVLVEMIEVASLRLSDDEVLLVQMPANSLNLALNEDGSDSESARFHVDKEYEDLLPRVIIEGAILDADVDRNGIEQELFVALKFVLDIEMRLSQKRKTDDTQMHASARYWVDETIETYLDLELSQRTSSGPDTLVDLLELQHLSGLYDGEGATIQRQSFRQSRCKLCLFLSAFTIKKSKIHKKVHHYIRSRIVAIQAYHSSPLPRMAVVVSLSLPLAREDHHRMMLQGAFIVRFANKFLDTYKTKKDFFFVTIFMGSTGEVIRRILYQKMSSMVVVYRERSFHISAIEDLLQFTLQLYNFASVWDAEDDKSDVAEKIQALMNILDTQSPLPAYDYSERCQSSQSQTDHSEGGSGGGLEGLEASGYKVVPDFLWTYGDEWEQYKLPPHIRTVYRRKDLEKTEYIAKLVRKGSREPDFFNFLHMTGSHSPHVISPIDTVTSATGNWLILPSLFTVDDRQLMKDIGMDNCSELGWGLIKGLAYLHEHKIAHRDIKPANLVYDSYFRLQIIDLDVAIKVEDENTETDKYRGTRGWTAPEMGTGDGPRQRYSPIRADRWSCGRVILRHIMVAGRVNRLSAFANLLMVDDPQQRPSLIEYCSM